MIKPSSFVYVKKSGFIGRSSKKVVWSVSKAMKYGYSNARVSAMKGLLLKKESLNELVRVDSINAMVEMLERTYYKDNFVKLSMHYHGSDLVQIATAMHFAEIANKLERIIPESDKEAFRVMLTKWDVINAKTILNAKRIGKKYEEVIPFIIPIGSFTEAEVKELLGETGETFFLKFTKTNLGKRFISSRIASGIELEKLFLHIGSTEVMKLEALLDIFYYSLYSSIGKFSTKELESIAKMFRREIDFKNALIIIRLKQHGINDIKEIIKYFIKGGIKSFDSFAPLFNAKSEDILILAGNHFGLKNTPKNTTELELMLNKKFASAKLNLFYRSILSIGTIISFLFIKEEEIDNLRKIVIGKEFGISDEKIKEMLVFPN